MRLLRRLPRPLRRRLFALRNRVCELLGDSLGALARWSGVALLIRHTCARGKVAILVYHNPDRDRFLSHVEYLSKRYAFIGLDDLVEALRTGDWSRIPRRGVVVTFDDGHRGNFELLDVIERYGLKPTVFLCSQIVATGRRYWWTLDGIDHRLLMSVRNEQRLALLHERHGYSQTANDERERQALSADEIARMAASVSFQSHTRFHPILPLCSDEECETEIVQSKAEVEALTGRECRHFAYPNGKYTEREIELLRRAGYASARTIETGWNDVRTDPYRLRILGMPDDASLNLVALQLTGIPYLRNLMFIR